MHHLITAAVVSAIVGLTPSALEHAQAITQRVDGQFDVVCLDGTQEVKTRDQVLGNQICQHLRTYSGRWNLQVNTAGFCDLDMILTRSETTVIQLSAKFIAPCPTDLNQTQNCRGLNCAIRLDNQGFDVDFSTAGRATLTRLTDGLKVNYRGNGGSNGGVGGGARTVTLDGRHNILQATNDNGLTWKSVCDDSFDINAAQVACRDMGYSGSVLSFTVGVYASESDFGWDELRCRGDEMALSDCRHQAWGMHDCGGAEHVALVCN